MQYAIDKQGRRVHIDSATRGEKYTCPFCHGEMIVKRGDVYAHHFAHKSKELCDPWYSDNKGEWHRAMQAKFPTECQEARVTSKDNPKYFHIADVLIDNIVIEFQHSPMTNRVFEERSMFYLKEGYQVTWIFDYSEKDIFYYQSKPVGSYTLIDCPVRYNDILHRSVDTLKAEWKHSCKTLIDYNPEWNKNGSKLQVWIYAKLSGKSNGFIVIPRYSYQEWKYFGGDVKNARQYMDWVDVLTDIHNTEENRKIV